MSHLPDDGLRASLSKRPTSAGIINTFRTLVRSRSRQSILQSSSGLNLVSPLSSVPSDISQNHLPDEALQHTYLDDSLLLGTENERRSLREQVTEGPPEMKEVLDCLEDTHHQPARVEAALRVADFLRDYPVTAVAAIWAASKNILDDHETPGAIPAGYRLLLACVKYKTLTPQERMFFFDSISREGKRDDFNLRFDVLVELCSYGRYVESLEPRMVPLLVNLLVSRFDVASRARRRSKAFKLSTAENEDLNRVFQLVKEVTKFNAKVFTEEHLILLLDQLLAICKSTGVETDISQSVGILDAMVTYSYVPESILEDSVKVLCEIYSQLEALEEQIWAVICNLLKSHLGMSTLNHLIKLLREPAHRDDYLSTTVRGAVLLLRSILILSEKENLPTPPIIDVVPALRDAVMVKSTKTIQGILQLVQYYVTDDNAFHILVEDIMWTEFSDIVTECACRLPKSAVKCEVVAGSNASLAISHMQAGEQAESFEESEILQKIVRSLSTRSYDLEANQKILILQLLMRIIKHVDDVTARLVIDLHEELNLLKPTNEEWLKYCSELREYLFEDRDRSSSVRTTVLKYLFDSCYLAEALDLPDAHLMSIKILAEIATERSPDILATLVEQAVTIATNTSDDQIFDSTVSYLESSLLHENMRLSKSTTTLTSELKSFETTNGSIVADSLVRIFLRCVNNSITKTIKIYMILLRISLSDVAPIDARVIVLRLLSHLRSDTNHAIFVVPMTDDDLQASTLHRAVDSVVPLPGNMELPSFRQTRTEDPINSRRPKSASNSTTDLTRSMSNKRIAATLGSRNHASTPSWLYSNRNAFPETPPKFASRVLYSSPPYENIEIDSQNSIADHQVLDVASWLDAVSIIISSTSTNVDNSEKGSDLPLSELSLVQWEIYSFVIVHISSQLANRSFFANAIPKIKSLRNLICEQLKFNMFPTPPAGMNQKRTDVAICLYNILTVLVSYHDYFNKVEEDEIIRVLILGLGGWEKTAECCIHAFSICCYEIPLSISKALENVLQRMSQIITQTQTAVHILEFLAGLARLPELLKNFREEEFRTVFGMCLRYLQAVRDQQNKSTQVRNRSSHPPARRIMPTAEGHRVRSLADDLPQYVYVLAYHVMTFWFMSCKIQDRPEKMSWIAKSLVYTNSSGDEVMDEQSLVLIDMMHRVSYSDRDETVADPKFSGPMDGFVEKRNWIVGLSILTIETAGRTGLSQITFRRPSTTRFSIVKPGLVEPPKHQESITLGLSTDAIHSESHVIVYPESLLQDLYSPFNFSPLKTYPDTPTLLPDDDATQRALNSFDRTPALDSHKIGVIYIGEAQTSEASILSNVVGSADFTAFLNGIGTLTRLKHATFNTQGLDREFDMDGEFTFCWRDRVSEVVFHVPTMMPTDLEHDPLCTNKKRHTGNDFVNIIFNNSGFPFAFETFPSDFNFVNIVVTPEARASFIETRLDVNSLRRKNTNLFYKVHVQTKPSLPSISPASQPKTISAASLPAFVRHLALNASVFSQVWAVREGGEHVSSWRTRLREINKLREKHCISVHPSDKAFSIEGTSTNTQTSHGTIVQTEARDREQPRDAKAMRRSSAAFLGGGTLNVVDTNV